MTFEQAVINIIEGKKSAPVLRALLQGMSQCYRAGMALRNFAYDKEILSVEKFPLPVISIGNIVAGGTGKTPFVRFLAQKLMIMGKVAILSRGYRSGMERSGKAAKIDHADVELYGDESSMLSRQLPEAMIWVGKERVESAKGALAQGAKCMILDDGMQHRKIARDIEIGMMDAADPFGKGFYLPRGFLRDSPRRLKEMDLIVVSGVQNEAQFDEAKAEIRRYTNCPIVGVQLEALNKEEIQGKRVGTFCGIAKPERFISSVKEAGAEVVESIQTLDHFSFATKELSLFSDSCKAKGAQMLVCTEKDAIKLQDHLALTLPVVVLKVELKISFGEAFFQELLLKIKELWRQYHE